jgi:hypothetical protein
MTQASIYLFPLLFSIKKKAIRPTNSTPIQKMIQNIEKGIPKTRGSTRFPKPKIGKIITNAIATRKITNPRLLLPKTWEPDNPPCSFTIRPPLNFLEIEYYHQSTPLQWIPKAFQPSIVSFSRAKAA